MKFEYSFNKNEKEIIEAYCPKSALIKFKKRRGCKNWNVEFILLGSLEKKVETKEYINSLMKNFRLWEHPFN